MEITNLNADETANLHCRIKDLENELKWSLEMWSGDLDQLEEFDPKNEGARWSREVIKETRGKWLSK